MNEPRPLRCGECGAALDSASEGGLCASCVFGLALEVSAGPQADSEGGSDARGSPPAIPGYELRELLGRGGMGNVWRAEQREPVRRDVAIKVVRAGFDSAEVAARFDAERQALAMMDHPHVARFFDAGTTADGQPYFVMEHVPGVPITRYCDERTMSVEDRIGLFADVCDSVHHAHQKGIIHRDLKPSNILVLDRDGRPEPKVIDFGIAKATRPRIFDRTNLTRTDQLLGTPEYMSPEQMTRGEGDIDVRADVYSLGAVLYELLTGAGPVDRNRLATGGLADVLHTVCSIDPPTPSEKVTSLGEARREAARVRATGPSALVSKLRGDLDRIAMKALEKDREHRYASAADLAADQRRFLRHEPVSAGPPGVAYRTRKLVRRHPVGVASGAVLLLSLFALAITMVLQARRVAVERDRASEQAAISRQVKDFLVEIFRVSDPGEARGSEVTAREVLDRGAARIRNEIEDPGVRAELLREMGIVYGNLGVDSEAGPLLREAAEIQVSEFGRTDPRTLATLDEVASVFARRGELAEAESLHADVVEGWRRQVSQEDPEYLNALHNLALVIRDRGRTGESRELLERIVATWRRLGREDEPGAMSALSNLAIQYRLTGRIEEAERLLQSTAEAQRRVLGESHSSYWHTRQNLANTYYLRGKFEPAAEIYAEVLARRSEHLGPEHPHTLVTANNLSGVLSNLGRFREADSLAARVVDVRRRTIGEDHALTLQAIHVRALVNMRGGERDTALALLEELAAHGADRLDWVEHEDFAPLRGDPRYDTLVSQVRARQGRDD